MAILTDVSHLGNFSPSPVKLIGREKKGCSDVAPDTMATASTAGGKEELSKEKDAMEECTTTAASSPASSTDSGDCKAKREDAQPQDPDAESLALARQLMQEEVCLEFSREKEGIPFWGEFFVFCLLAEAVAGYV